MQRLDYLSESPSQTAGPYVHIGCTPNSCGIADVYQSDLGAVMYQDGVAGDKIEISGVILDGTGTPLRDAIVEIWQADAQGLYPGPGETRGPADRNFFGWGRQATDRDSGEFLFRTVRPGRVPAPCGRLMAPHVSFWIVARGINIGLHTRMYFPEEDNATDPVIASIEHKVRAQTLIAEPNGTGGYRFDVRLQGERETVFFDI